MKNLFRNQADKVVFFICLAFSVGLIVGGFFVPPRGVIDGSVLTGCGILLGFATLAVVAQATKDGRKATFKRGDVELSINDNDDDDTD